MIFIYAGQASVVSDRRSFDERVLAGVENPWHACESDGIGR